LKGVMLISIIFISNELLDPRKCEDLHLPLEFLSFGFTEGKLYKHYRNDGTFLAQYGKDWGNNVVYGALFALKDPDFYLRLLDSYHQCSRSVLGRNHSKDVHHRINKKVTPISFATIEDFIHLKYREREEWDAEMYVGNLTHPKLNQRLTKTVSYRITSGVDLNFIKRFREETK
jgi:hypothetical protein